MSDTEQKFGIEGIEHDSGYIPIPEAPPARSDEQEHADAIETWSKNRTQEAEAKPIIDRSYIRTDGDDIGKPYPKEGTVPIDRAAKELAEVREFEDAVAEFERTQKLAVEIDQARGFRPDLDVQQPQDQQPVQPEQQQYATTDNDEVARVLQQHPKVLAAVQQEYSAQAARVDAALTEMAQTSMDTANLAASVVLNHPSLRGIPANQLPAAMSVLERENPQAAGEIRNQVQAVAGLAQQAIQAQQVQTQRAHSNLPRRQRRTMPSLTVDRRRQVRVWNSATRWLATQRRCSEIRGSVTSRYCTNGITIRCCAHFRVSRCLQMRRATECSRLASSPPRKRSRMWPSRVVQWIDQMPPTAIHSRSNLDTAAR